MYSDVYSELKVIYVVDLKANEWPGMVVHTFNAFNASTQKAEAGRLVSVSEFKPSLVYIVSPRTAGLMVRPCLKK